METPMKKYCKALGNLAIAVIVLLLIIFLLPKVLVFFLPFVIGWIIAWIAGPPVRFFEEKLKLKRKAGSAFVIVVVIGLVVLGIYLVGAKIVDETIGFINALPDMWENAEADFAEIGERLGVIYARFPKDVQETLAAIGEEASTFMGDLLGRISSPTIAAVGNFAKRLPTLLISVIMCLLSSYFFVAERNHIIEWCHAHVPRFLMKRLSLIKHSLGRSVGGYFKAQLKIEVWMYLLLVIGLSILRVDYVLLIAFGIAILDLLPFFGTGTVMVPWAIIKILSSDYKMAIGLLIIWGVGQLARQIIQPKIVGDSIGVPPIPTLLLLFVGYKVGGVIGMIIAVPLGLLLYTLYEEGAFDTTKNSLLILIAGINRFRKLKPHDLEEVEDMMEAERKAK
ncbi:MAG: sporulation integral membrane protein YtvI [Lachnospiraceae bacterium]|nr:sporulation integral membrane protein YtvI [Lachnospiraceae bacterium]